MASWRVLIPTLRLEGSQFFITYNPKYIDDAVHDMFVVHEHPEALVIEINYDENPFLSDTSKTEIEYMRSNNPEDFKWIYGGECRTSSVARILYSIQIHDFEIDTSRQPFYGLDVGYEDANALTQSYIYDNELYICREFYENHLDPEQLKQKLINLDWIRGQHIICDSSAPAIIRMLNSAGRFSVAGARKNIGNKQKEGLYKFYMALYLKTFKAIHIHETNCPNASREFQKWAWQTDKNEKILDIVQDGGDHTCDSLIYALERNAAIWFKSNIKR